MAAETTVKKKQVEYPIYKMEKKGKLFLPPEVVAQITFLHSQVGNTEWSGMLLYDVTGGDPSKPEEFKLTAKHIFLMDIGSAAYTEYETTGDIVDIYDEIPEAMEMKLGHIHTHHTMGAYFSATDMSELMDNVDKHNYYLSLIVNFKGDYVAKVVFLSDMHTTAKMNFTNDAGIVEHFKQMKVEKHIVVIDMTIYYQGVGEFFVNRLTDIQKQIKEAEAKKLAMRPNYSGGGSFYGGHNGGYKLPAHQPNRQVGSPIDIKDMTSWEVEKLTKNVLMCDMTLRTEENVYAILNKIGETHDGEIDIYYDQLMASVETVVDEFFDTFISPDEFEIIIGEMVSCISRYEGIPKLKEVVKSVTEVFGHVLISFEPEVDDVNDISDKPTDTIADQLDKAERELHD